MGYGSNTFITIIRVTLLMKLRFVTINKLLFATHC